MQTNNATPNAATAANSTNPAKQIQDVLGNTALYLNNLYQIKILLTLIKAVSDAGDPNLTLINTALTAIG